MKKKLVSSLVVAALLMNLTACGYDDSSTDITKIDCSKYVTSLGEYENLVAYADLEEVTDETVEDYLDYMMYNSQELYEVDRAVQSGDVVNIDYVGTMDGEEFDGGSSTGVDLEIGGGRYIDGFEDGLIGANKGDVVELDLTFPEDYTNSDLAGKDVVFTVTINTISEYQVPTLDDEYVQSLYIEDCNTVDDFKKVAKESLESTALYNYNSDIESQVQEEFYNNCTFTDEVPEALYDYYHNMILENDETQSESAGMDLETFVYYYYGIESLDDYYSQVEDGAKKSVQQAMASYLLAKKLKLTVSDKELQQNIEDNYEDFGFTSADDFRSYMNEADYRAYLMEENVLNYLVENADVHPTSEQTDTITTDTEE